MTVRWVYEPQSPVSPVSRHASSAMCTLVISASAVTPTNMTIARAPIAVSVSAAFLDLGLRKAGTPLEMASTPVSAVQPEENARSTSISRARPVRFASEGSGVTPYPALSATGASPRA